MNRRELLTGLGALLAAPAIVRASNIMPVKSFADADVYEIWKDSDLVVKATERMGPMWIDERLLEGAYIDDQGRLMLPRMVHQVG